MHIHRWGKWADVKIADEVEFPHGWGFPVMRQIIRQQRRCSVCNLVKTRP